MASHIQIVLKKSVQNLGSAGELVRVRPGYARNFLIPFGHAAFATRGNIAQLEHEKRVALAQDAKLRAEAQGVAGKINGLTLEIKVQAGEGDKLFGSIGTKDIAEALEAKGHKIDRKSIVLPEAIKTVGEQKVSIKFGYEVVGEITVKTVKA